MLYYIIFFYIFLLYYILLYYIIILTYFIIYIYSVCAHTDDNHVRWWNTYKTYPICSMYGIFTNIYPKNHPNVGKYTIHGAYGICLSFFQPGGHVPLRRGLWLRRHHVSLTACPWDFHHGTEGKTIWGHIGLGKKRFRIGNLPGKVMVMGNGI